MEKWSNGEMRDYSNRMRRNKNRGYQKLRVWDDAIEYYVKTCEVFRKFPYELKPDYVQMTKERLNKPFTGLDSIDERMERVPLDLRDDGIREEYLANHVKWFLQHHNGSVERFKISVEEMYGDRI